MTNDEAALLGRIVASCSGVCCGCITDVEAIRQRLSAAWPEHDWGSLLQYVDGPEYGMYPTFEAIRDSSKAHLLPPQTVDS